MRYVVAGAVLLLALIVGIISTIVTIFFDMVGENEEEIEVKNKEVPATTLTGFLKEIDVKQYSIISFIAVLCGIVSYQIYGMDIDVLSKIRLIAVAELLLSVMVIDLKTHRIPNVLTLALLGLGILYLIIAFFMYPKSFGNALVTSLVGLVCCLILFYLLARLTKEGIGMGDVKTIAALGFVLGLGTTIMVVMIALFICTFIAVFLMLGKKKNKNESIPFGPFLFFGYIIVLLLSSM